MNRKKSAEINIDILDRGYITIDGNRINLIKAAKKSNKGVKTFCLLGTKKEEDYTTAKDYDNLHIYRSIPMIDIITNPVYYQEIGNNDENAIPTIVAYSTSSDINDTFSFLNKGTIGDCLRNSNLSIIYKKRKKLIKEMVRASSNINDAVVLEIPNLIFYLRDGLKLRNPMIYNLIVIYFNIPDKMSNSQAQEIYKKISMEIPNKTLEAALLSNSKHLLINPLDITDKFNISKYVKNWKNVMNSMKFKDNINSLSFVINENQEEFFQTKKKVLEYYDINDASTV